ncbi:hypothetical protein [Ruminococcus sp. HUN007]|uniref:hypothetical protein n=1 Tax=Ruminococcus sp. HUN007 TaxID=1514668 RepID=UPI0005D29283|nr:hypothetical protein [Ruminococcus sp. HUN007]
MFDKEYAFKGMHAEYVNNLTKEFDNAGHRLFSRNFDVYLLAPVIGFLYQRKSEMDSKPDIKPTKIFGDILFNNRDDLMFNYRLIMLLDVKNEPNAEKRIDKAFRGENVQSDIDLYESYVRGGVEVLYEKLMQGVNNPEDYTIRLYEFLEEFDTRYNQEIDMDSLLELCRKIRA